MFQFFWSRNASVWTAVLYILLGLLLAIFPGMSGTIFVWVLAAAAAVFGLVHLGRYLRGRKTNQAVGGSLLLGIIALLFALFCALRPHAILSFLPLVLGILCLLDGIGKLPIAIAFVQDRSGSLIPALISTVLPILVGILLIINPFGAAKMVIMIFGIGLILDGISDLVTASMSGRNS